MKLWSKTVYKMFLMIGNAGPHMSPGFTLAVAKREIIQLRVHRTIWQKLREEQRVPD